MNKMKESNFSGIITNVEDRGNGRYTYETTTSLSFSTTGLGFFTNSYGSAQVVAGSPNTYNNKNTFFWCTNGATGSSVWGLGDALIGCLCAVIVHAD